MLSALILLLSIALILCNLSKFQNYFEKFGNQSEPEIIIDDMKPFITTPKTYTDGLCNVLDSLGDDSLDIQDSTITPSQNIGSDDLANLVTFILDKIRLSVKDKNIGSLHLLDVTGNINKSGSFSYYEIKGMLHNSTRRITNKILAEVYADENGYRIKRVSATCNNPMTPVLSSEMGSYKALPMDITIKTDNLEIGYPVELDPMISEIENCLAQTVAEEKTILGDVASGGLNSQSLIENFENPSSVVRRLKNRR